MDRIKLIIVEDDAETRANVTESLANVEYVSVVGEAETLEEALELIDETNPEVVLIGAYIPGNGYKLAERIYADNPGISMIMIERELKEETMRKAIFAGAKDVLIYPFTPSKLVDSIYRVYQVDKKKKAIQREVLPKTRRKAKQGQIFTVFSTKGGVGKTFVSTNLAVTLAQNNKEEKVVLVDLDLDFGNTALALNIIPRYTIADVINEIRNLDQDLMEGYLTSHRSGIKLLASNAHPQLNEFVNAEHIEIILKVLQSRYDFVVVDMPARFHDPVDPAFHEADLLFLVTSQDIATLRNIKAAMVALNSLNYPKSKIKILLNKAEKHSDVKIADVETTLNSSLFGIIPAEHKLVSSSLNKGIPITLLYPRARISKEFEKLTRRILGDGEPAAADSRPAGETS